MKKVANIVLLAVLAAGLLSCTKTDRFYGNPQKEIAMNPVMHSMTKAEVPGPVTGSQYPDAEHFGVIAYYSPSFTHSQEWTNTSSVLMYLDGHEFEKEGSTFSGIPKCYWPFEGSLVFAGYSPYDLVGMPSFAPATKTLMIDNFVSDGQTDLMYFLPQLSNGNLVGVLDSENSVSAAFSHALTLLEFNIKGIEGDEPIRLKKISIASGDWYSQGDFTAVAGGSPAWSGVVASGSELRIFDSDADELLSTTPVSKSGLVIPGETVDMAASAVDITISYEITAAQTHQKTGTISATLQPTWEIGKKYTYDITISSNFINVVPQSGDFGTGTGSSVNIW